LKHATLNEALLENRLLHESYPISMPSLDKSGGLNGSMQHLPKVL
jgi:hypothetical protein